MTDRFVSLDASDLLALAGKLEGISGPALNQALIPAVNAVIERFDSSALRGMTAGINLDPAYVSSKMEVAKATTIPEASITVAGPGRQGREGLVILGHYNARPASGNIGNPAGVIVDVTKGSPSLLTRRTFLMKLKRGDAMGTTYGVFERTGKDQKGEKHAWKHLYGVAPYSLFQFQAGQQSDQVLDDLEQTALKAISEVVNL